MNVLVELLAHEPDIVQDLGKAEVVPFERLARILRSAEETRDFVRAADEERELGAYIHDSYLGSISAVEWNDALHRASGWDATASPEWVIMVPGPYGDRGLTVPQDSSPVRRLSLFVRVGPSVRRVSIDRVRNSPWSVSLSVSLGHCGLPDRGHCDPGQCGSCDVRVREAEPRGLVCLCGHS